MSLIMITDDHGETFDREACMPAIAMFTGSSGTGNLALVFEGRNDGSADVTLKCHRELAQYLSRGLVKRDFDIAIMSSDKVKALGVPERGMGHGFTRTAPKIMPKLDVPTVMFWLNCYYEPLPTARRCIELGRTLAELLKDRPERVAIFGTGGLSHDPRGPRGGWIDEPLDRFVLDAFAKGEPDRLQSLFEFDSDTLRGGTGEIPQLAGGRGCDGRDEGRHHRLHADPFGDRGHRIRSLGRQVMKPLLVALTAICVAGGVEEDPCFSLNARSADFPRIPRGVL